MHLFTETKLNESRNEHTPKMKTHAQKVELKFLNWKNENTQAKQKNKIHAQIYIEMKAKKNDVLAPFLSDRNEKRT